jgi:hypothetical protein
MIDRTSFFVYDKQCCRLLQVIFVYVAREIETVRQFDNGRWGNAANPTQ